MRRNARYKGRGRILHHRSDQFQMGYACALRDAINDTHIEAEKMNHPMARDVLNARAHSLGVMKWASNQSRAGSTRRAGA